MKEKACSAKERPHNRWTCDPLACASERPQSKVQTFPRTLHSLNVFANPVKADRWRNKHPPADVAKLSATTAPAMLSDESQAAAHAWGSNDQSETGPAGARKRAWREPSLPCEPSWRVAPAMEPPKPSARSVRLPKKEALDTTRDDPEERKSAPPSRKLVELLMLTF